MGLLLLKETDAVSIRETHNKDNAWLPVAGAGRERCIVSGDRDTSIGISPETSATISSTWIPFRMSSPLGN